MQRQTTRLNCRNQNDIFFNLKRHAPLVCRPMRPVIFIFQIAMSLARKSSPSFSSCDAIKRSSTYTKTRMRPFFVEILKSVLSNVSSPPRAKNSSLQLIKPKQRCSSQTIHCFEQQTNNSFSFEGNVGW